MFIKKIKSKDVQVAPLFIIGVVTMDYFIYYS